MSATEHDGAQGEAGRWTWPRRPERQAKSPPCQAACPGGNDIRGWLGLIAQRAKLGLPLDDAYRQAWEKLAATNPLPATLGRVCPHPCESGCNRQGKDGAVAVNAMERFLGDWAIREKLSLPQLAPTSKPAAVSVLGAGPAGLSFAYQMARRGHRVRIYDRFPEAGGMLRYGIPKYRLPKEVLAAETQRILDLCADVRLGTDVGRDLSVAELRNSCDILFLGVGAAKGKGLGVPGENGPGVWSGVDYLNARNRGQDVDLGARVVVVGGGDTAIDAARMARRNGAEVTILYRRTRAEMPAVDEEIEDALREGVRIEFLAAPVAVRRDGDALRALRVQRMELGEPDSSGRRRPVPVPNSEFDVPADAVIAAISQEPDWSGLDELRPRGPLPDGSLPTAKSDTLPLDWVQLDDVGGIADGMWGGGDAAGLSIAVLAVFHGRRAAESAHSRFTGEPLPARSPAPFVGPDEVDRDAYPDRVRATSPRRPETEWLARPDAEITGTISETEFLGESSRCYSCGLCFGCERCWMFCNPQGYTRLQEVAPGAYYALALDQCEGCGKCIELCPCGFIAAAPKPAGLAQP